MRAMVLHKPGTPLLAERVADPVPALEQVLVKVLACGVCRTDLHVVDGDLSEAKLPIIPGHEIVGRVEAIGSGVSGLRPGDRIGIPWLGHSCGLCPYCRAGAENLCDAPGFTGYHIDGGYAEYAVAEAKYCLALPDAYADTAAAPLLCAGLIGYRALRKAGPGRRLGIYGFGAAAHIVAQVAQCERREVYAFTRAGDVAAQSFARQLGCVWAGSSTERSPAELDAAIIFAPVGGLLPAALASVRKGGSVVLAGIYMSDIPSMPYALLWGERTLRSVANLTRQDANDFLELAARTRLDLHVEGFALEDANVALERLRSGQLTGAAVLVP
jgi:propanol-preferring alcohol dehydrogenase